MGYKSVISLNIVKLWAHCQEFPTAFPINAKTAIIQIKTNKILFSSKSYLELKRSSFVEFLPTELHSSLASSQSCLPSFTYNWLTYFCYQHQNNKFEYKISLSVLESCSKSTVTRNLVFANKKRPSRLFAVKSSCAILLIAAIFTLHVEVALLRSSYASWRITTSYVSHCGRVIHPAHESPDIITRPGHYRTTAPAVWTQAAEWYITCFSVNFENRDNNSKNINPVCYTK